MDLHSLELVVNNWSEALLMQVTPSGRLIFVDYVDETYVNLILPYMTLCGRQPFNIAASRTAPLPPSSLAMRQHV
jgi:hypothetical protein